MDINITHWSVVIIFPLLSVMTLLPLITIIGVWRSPCAVWGLRCAYAGAVLNLLLGVYLLLVFDSNNAGIHLAEHLSFLGMSYAVGVDSTNILFIPLTTVLTLLALIYTSINRHADDKLFIGCLLGYQAILIGAFAALNVLQFWFWTALELIPLILLTVHSGTGQHRRWVASRLFQYWLGSLLMTFAGFMLLGFGLIDAQHPLSFDWLLLKQNNAYLNDEVLIFLLLFFGFAVRMPLFPFHGWLPLLAEHGTVASAAIYLVGLKLGVYALIRFILPMVPGVAEQWESFVLTLALISIFYGALMALIQINLRRLLAFAVLSHTGMLVIGVFSFNAAGLESGLLLSNVCGLATAGMLICSGLIYERTRTSYIPRLGGLFNSNMTVAVLFLICVLSTVVVPAAHLLIEGAIEEDGWLMAITILLGNVLMAGFLLRAFQQMFIAKPKRAIHAYHCTHHSVLKERVIAVMIGGLLIVSGFWFKPWLKFIAQDAVAISFMFPKHNAEQHHDK